MFVPVVDKNQRPIMPTTPARARKWIKCGKATAFFKQGVFCVRLNVEPSGRELQDIAVGIDPGSKKEGFTVKSAAHTFLNIQANAVTWVKKAIEQRRNARLGRRYRTTPCRQNRKNRAGGCIPPSTFARWNWKLRILKWLAKLFPVACTVVENVATQTKKGQRRWNKSFSPLEVGKHWFYGQVRGISRLELKQGWETAELRIAYGLKKTGRKMAEVFEAHCVDSWVLANWFTGGHLAPDNTSMLCITPIQLHRRQLHMFQPAIGGERKRYGGTQSIWFKRGSLVEHKTLGLAYVGGHAETTISLHDTKTGQRLTQQADPFDCVAKTLNVWKRKYINRFVVVPPILGFNPEVPPGGLDEI